MAATLKFYYGTEAEILALSPTSANWVERAFYYPDDKTYFFQVVNGVMQKYGFTSSGEIGVGVMLNGLVLGGVKSLIENSDILEIPVNWEYNIFNLDVDGIINNNGIINLL